MVKQIYEKVMEWLFWPVSLLAYAMILLALVNIIVWLWSVLVVRVCPACQPCGIESVIVPLVH